MCEKKDPGARSQQRESRDVRSFEIIKKPAQYQAARKTRSAEDRDNQSCLTEFEAPIAEHRCEVSKSTVLTQRNATDPEGQQPETPGTNRLTPG